MKKSEKEVKKDARKVPNPNITCDILQVFRSEPYDKYNRMDIRLVKWSGGKLPVVEKRRVWNLKDGTLVNRQLAGINEADFDFLIANQTVIKKAFKDYNDKQVSK